MPDLTRPVLLVSDFLSDRNRHNFDGIAHITQNRVHGDSREENLKFEISEKGKQHKNANLDRATAQYLFWTNVIVEVTFTKVYFHHPCPVIYTNNNI